MKLELNEATLNAYITEAINEELDEFLRNDAKSRKWGYNWDDSLSWRENRRRRKEQIQKIKDAGYRNYEDYEAGEAIRNPVQPKPAGGEEPGGGTPSPAPAPAPAPAVRYPEEYPYKNDRTVTGKYKTGQFQTWFNLPPEKGGMGGNLVVDGIWGKNTEAAYQQWLQKVQPSTMPPTGA